MTHELTEVIRRHLAAFGRAGVADDFERQTWAALEATVEKFAALRCPRCGTVGMVIDGSATEPAAALTSAVVTFSPACPLCMWRSGDGTSLEDAGESLFPPGRRAAARARCAAASEGPWRWSDSLVRRKNVNRDDCIFLRSLVPPANAIPRAAEPIILIGVQTATGIYDERGDEKIAPAAILVRRIADA